MPTKVHISNDITIDLDDLIISNDITIDLGDLIISNDITIDVDDLIMSYFVGVLKGDCKSKLANDCLLLKKKINY